MAKIKHPKDPRGGHIRLYWAIYDSLAWRALSNADKLVYLAMRRRLLSTNNGNIAATLAQMKEAGIKSSSTLATALRRLEQVGLIEKTRQGGIASGGKSCSLYRFTDEATFDLPKLGVSARPATNEWRQFKTLVAAQAATRRPEISAATKIAAKVQESKLEASKIEADAPSTDSISEDEAN